MQVPFQHIQRKKHIPKSFTKTNDGKHAYVSLWMDYHFTSRSGRCKETYRYAPAILTDTD